MMDGVSDAAADILSVADISHRSAVHSLSAIDGVALVEVIHAAVVGNYDAGGASANRDRSRQNWRWTLNTGRAEHNKSAEVIVERAIAGACARLGRRDWANQIPVASGLIAPTRDRRRAIDLARLRAPGHYDLIELKIASDTPLFAAVELLGYASLWLIARADPPNHRPELLDARRIGLRVLAPAAFYAAYALHDLEKAVDRGVEQLGLKQGVEMTFGFAVLDERIGPEMICDDTTLLELITDSPPLHATSLQGGGR